MMTQTYSDENFTLTLNDDGITIFQHSTQTEMVMDIAEGRSILDMFEYLLACLAVLRNQPQAQVISFPANMMPVYSEDIPDDVSGLDEN